MLIQRRYQISDANDMFRNWVTDSEVNRFWGWKPHENIDETKKLLENVFNLAEITVTIKLLKMNGNVIKSAS